VFIFSDLATYFGAIYHSGLLHLSFTTGEVGHDDRTRVDNVHLYHSRLLGEIVEDRSKSNIASHSAVIPVAPGNQYLKSART
jgi:hypothetical protein